MGFFQIFLLNKKWFLCNTLHVYTNTTVIQDSRVDSKLNISENSTFLGQFFKTVTRTCYSIYLFVLTFNLKSSKQVVKSYIYRIYPIMINIKAKFSDRLILRSHQSKTKARQKFCLKHETQEILLKLSNQFCNNNYWIYFLFKCQCISSLINTV